MCIVHKHHCSAGAHTWYEQVDCGEVNANIKCEHDLPELKDQGAKTTCKLHSTEPPLSIHRQQRPLRNTYDVFMSLKRNRVMPGTYPIVSASQGASATATQGEEAETIKREGSPELEMISAEVYDYPWLGETDAEFIERVLLKRRRMPAHEAFRRLDQRKLEQKKT